MQSLGKSVPVVRVGGKSQGSGGKSKGGSGSSVGRTRASAKGGGGGQQCPRGPSATYENRPSAWCGSKHGRFAVAPTAPSAASLCMLMPVFPPHFSHLATRVQLTYQLVVDEPPTLVAVFDDVKGIQQFCRTHAKACTFPRFHRLNLATLVGPSMYGAARGMLSTGGWQKRERLRNSWWPGDALAKECGPKFSGQCYQTLKKFYGAAAGPAHCKHYWVSDAETYPFRPYNFSDVARFSFEADGRLFRHVISWYPSRWGCTHHQNLYSDASCGEWVATHLEMGAYPEADFGALRNGPALLGAKMRQTVFDVNNWWWYDRGLIQAIIDRTELVRGQHFVHYFASLQTTDVAFFDYVFEHLVTLPGATMAMRNFLADLQAALPKAFAACCACGGNATKRPCYDIDDLWGECFRRHASLRRIGAFMVERLGVFGLFANKLATAPPNVIAGLFDAEPRLAWAVNNAPKWRAPRKWSSEYLLKSVVPSA